MSRSATPATRNESTRLLKHPKMTPSAELTIGTAIRPSRERLRTVADGCERLRTVANVNAMSSEHTLNPQTPRVKREPLLRIREKESGSPNIPSSELSRRHVTILDLKFVQFFTVFKLSHHLPVCWCHGLHFTTEAQKLHYLVSQPHLLSLAHHVQWQEQEILIQ